MKTLFRLATVALLAWAAAAPALAAPPANLTISSERGQPFSLVLDGRLLTRPVARQVRVGWLAPGRHWADISLPSAYGPPLHFRTSVWLEPGLETSYVLLVRPYGPQLRQVGQVVLGRGPAYQPGTYPGGAYPPQPGGAYPAQPGGAYPPQPGGAYGGPPQGGYDDRQNAPSNGQAGDPNTGQYEQPAPAAGQDADPRNGQYDNDNQGNAPAPAPGYPAPNGNNSPSGGYPAPTDGYNPTPAAPNLLSPTDAANLTQALRQRNFDDERLRIAKQALSQTSVRANDLAELMKTLTYDKSRIELAKFAYDHVADPQNFYRVYDAFQFSSSARELQDAVAGPQR